MSQRRIGAIEAGGTKFRAAITTEDGQLGEQIRVETGEPAETMAAVLDFFAAQDPVEAVGIASFGPLIVDPASPDYGTFAPTPKPGWTGYPLLAAVRDALGVPVDIQTDVEAAAVAELQKGAAVGCDSVAYVTVGTGIGVGVVLDGKVFRGRDHLEIGHIWVQRGEGDEFPGRCPFHGDCLEGLACGPAIEERWGARPSSLDDREDVWELEADYLAQLACTITWALSPDRILFSGGVGARSHLAPRIAAATKRRLGGYSVSHSNSATLIATAELGNDAGLVGAALLGASLS